MGKTLSVSAYTSFHFCASSFQVAYSSSGDNKTLSITTYPMFLKNQHCFKVGRGRRGTERNKRTKAFLGLPTKNLRSRQRNLEAGPPHPTPSPLPPMREGTPPRGVLPLLKQSTHVGREELLETPRFCSALFVSRARIIPASASASTLVSSAACTKLGI